MSATYFAVVWEMTEEDPRKHPDRDLAVPPWPENDEPNCNTSMLSARKYNREWASRESNKLRKKGKWR